MGADNLAAGSAGALIRNIEPQPGCGNGTTPNNCQPCCPLPQINPRSKTGGEGQAAPPTSPSGSSPSMINNFSGNLNTTSTDGSVSINGGGSGEHSDTGDTGNGEQGDRGLGTCSSCGAGKVNGPRNALPPLTIKRHINLSDIYEPSSLGPGVFLDHDVQVRLSFANRLPTSLKRYDPCLVWGAVLAPVAGTSGQSYSDPVQTIGTTTFWADYSASTMSGTPLPSDWWLGDASRLTVRQHDGRIDLYELININQRLGLDPRTNRPLPALPAGTITAVGLAAFGVPGNQIIRWDQYELVDGGGTVFYRENFRLYSEISG
jgi:hypothetical protein